MKTLEIDIETYSDVDLAKCGVYRYCESPQFEILLFGYSIDEAPVQVVDLCAGETIPEDVLSALTDDSVIKWAHNASFERICLSRWLRQHHPERFVSYSVPEDTVGNYLDPASWRCSMVWSAYMGLPLSLKDVGAILKLDEQKLSEGKDLVRFFCTPCKPTIANGGRTRNHPADDPAKWALFKKYNARDVEVEQAIRNRLQKYPVPDFVWDEYHLSEEINDRGIAIDSMVVDHAIEMDARSRAELSAEVQRCTALANPSSVAQMKDWLAKNGVMTETLGKKAVAYMMAGLPEDIQHVLRLRQQLARSSVRKYTAMQSALCADGRARGMFAFYGANRTGRWCLTGDHEVLSPDGWIRLDAWTGGPIACWNSASEAVSFQSAEMVSFPYNGPVVVTKPKRKAIQCLRKALDCFECGIISMNSIIPIASDKRHKFSTLDRQKIILLNTERQECFSRWRGRIVYDKAVLDRKPSLLDYERQHGLTDKTAFNNDWPIIHQTYMTDGINKVSIFFQLRLYLNQLTKRIHLAPP